MSQTPEFSIISTVYNNVSTMARFLDSVLDAVESFDYEFVIVDNYSNDGTYEVLKNFTLMYPQIRLYRYRCTRGRGIKTAFQLSKGRYIIYVSNTDEVRDPLTLRLIVEAYLKWFRGEVLLPLIFPREVLEVACWRDLNRAEDVELLANVFLNSKVNTLPITTNVDVDDRRTRVLYTPLFLPTDWHREKRYAEGLWKYLSRFIRNKMDMVCGGGYNIRKVIQMYRYAKRKSIPWVFASTVYHFFFILLNKLRRVKIFHADPNLTNYHFVTYMQVMTMIDPIQFGFHSQAISLPNLNEHSAELISRFRPDIVSELNMIRERLHGVRSTTDDSLTYLEIPKVYRYSGIFTKKRGGRD
jgi:glycosyltransferase involved in cell wall biosynthesis